MSIRNRLYRVGDKQRSSLRSPFSDDTIISQFSCRHYLEEAERISKYLFAHMRKDSKRRAMHSDKKAEILSKQGNCCRICDKKLTIVDSELDHIIPWELVGDGLGEENNQMICKDCNRRKSNRLDYLLCRLLSTNPKETA